VKATAVAAMPSMLQSPRSRSPRHRNLSSEAREEFLTEFAKHYWVRPDVDTPPFAGRRAVEIMRFRDRLLEEVESAGEELWDPEADCHGQRFEASKATVVRWQRFTFFEDLVRMSDVLFRGPIEPTHGDDVQRRLDLAWRQVRSTIGNSEVYLSETVDYRVSAMRVAMMLETARPPEASELDGLYELPDARTLSSLLLLRCEKDDEEELMEMYRLVCQKLQGQRCTRCAEPIDERSAAGLFDGSTLSVPSTVPKILVPCCGHAVHTLCFGSQLLPDQRCNGVRGLCRRCGVPYGWASIDVDPMVSAFCLLFGSYVDNRAQEMLAEGQIVRSEIVRIAEICQSFSLELDCLVSSAHAWMLLKKRHAFECPEEAIDVISESVLDLLMHPSPGQDADEMPRAPLGPLVRTAVVCPEDRNADDDSLSDVSSGLREERKHLTEVFLPDVDTRSDGGRSEAFDADCEEGQPGSEGDVSPRDVLPPLSLPPSVCT